jgi:putative peptidoglycan lipid II flippase
VLARGIRLVTFLVLPSALGLCFLAEPIISALFQHGKFTADNRLVTAAALRGYGLGLLAYSWLKVLQPAFYAADRRWVPMLVSFFAIALSISSNWYFVVVRGMGVEALALTTSIVATVNFGILYFAMSRIISGLETRMLAFLFAKLVTAGLAMVGVCLLADRWVFYDLTAMSSLARIGGLAVVIPLAGGIYFVIARLLGVEEALEFTEILARRFKKRAS